MKKKQGFSDVDDGARGIESNLETLADGTFRSLCEKLCALHRGSGLLKKEHAFSHAA